LGELIDDSISVFPNG